MNLSASPTSLEPYANTLSEQLNKNPGSYFIKSWSRIHNHACMHLHLYYNSITQSFSAILQSPSTYELIPNTKNGFELIKMPILDCKATKSKLMSLPPLKLVQFLRKELRYPLIRGDKHDYTVQFNIGGLLGGGAKISRVSAEVKEQNIDQGSNTYLNVYDFLMERYAIRVTKNNDSKDEVLIDRLATRICNALPTGQILDVDKILTKGIDACEEEFFEEVVLEVLGKSLEEGRLELTDYTRSFSSGKLCIELLKKVYFARERGKGGVSKLIVDKVLAKVGKETESVITKLQKKTEDKSAKDKPALGKALNKDQKEVNFERALMVLETQDKLTSLLEPLSKIKHKKVMNFIRHKLNLETDDSKEILNACCFADNGDEICEQIINDVLSTKLEMDSSSILLSASPTSRRDEILSAKSAKSTKSANKSVLVSEVSSPDIKPKEAKTSKRLPYMDKVRLSVLSELNLLEHDLTTLVELHNMLKADISAQNADSGTIFQGNSNTKSSKLYDFRNLIMDIIRTYKETESTLGDEQLSSLLPLAFVQDTEIFRAFLEAFLQDFSNDILFEVKKVRMLSFIIISALRNPDFKDYLQVDDLIRCLKILKPKIEDLSITSGNLNLQEAISSLNDILYLMGFIGAKGVKGDYLEMVKDLTTHMQTHGLEKAFNILSRKGTDPSLAIKREYALEAFKRIEGTSFENWTENCAKIIQVTQIAVNIGKGLFLGDMTSICTALMQIKDMAMDAYANLPRTWFVAANELKFLAEEPLEKIIKEVFRSSQKQNENFSFYVAELMLLVVNQSHRKPKEKKTIIQALWCLVNGYDYKQCKAQRYLVRSRAFRPNKNLCEYAKVTLLAIAERADMDLAIFIRKIVETPIKITSLDNNQTDFKINIKQSEEEAKQDEDAGRMFYWKVLREKKPKLYALAKIQEHSAKTLDKPTVMIDFRGINGEKDFDDNFVKKLNAKIDNSKDRKFLDDLVKAVDDLDPKTATKKSIADLFDKDGTTEIVRSEEDKGLKTVKNDLREKTKSKIDQMKDANALMLLDALPIFLNDPSKKVWLIQGDAGTGKSLLLRLMEQKLWKRYDILVKADTKSKNRLPLRIVLSEVRNFDKAIDEFLLRHGCDQDGINDIKREPTVILFDGYDEINQFINLYNQNKLETWTDVKVIFTSRKENLTALKEDYIFCFTPGKDKNKVLSYSILGVNEEQIRKFFDAQAQENVQQIQKLEKKLTTFIGKNLNVPPITEAVRRTIERWENFPSSAKYKWLVEFIATLEEGMPDVEEFQKDLDALKSDTVEIQSLTEIFKEYIADLKNVINPTTIKAVISKIQNCNQTIENTENQLANLKCDNKHSTTIDIDTSIQYLKKLTTLKTISKSLTNISEHVNKALSIEDVGKKRISPYIGSSSAEKLLTDLIALATPEKFKEKAELVRANIQEMKAFGNEIATAINTESKDALFEYIEKELNKVEQFSDFDKLKTVVEKLQKTLKEFIVIEGDLECLYAKENVVQGQEKEDEKEIENKNLAQGQEKGQQPQEEQQQIQEKQEQKDSSYQGNIQPTTIIKIELPPQNAPQATEQGEQLPDLEKLKSLITKLDEIKNACEESCKELAFLGDYHQTRKTQQELDTFFKTANNGSVPAVEKIEDKYKKFSQLGKFWSDYDSFIEAMDSFIPSDYPHTLVWKLNAPCNQLKELMYLWEIQVIFKTLEENVSIIHSSIQELRYPKKIKEDSKLIQALQKQLTVLQTSADQDKIRPSISKLDEMIQEIKGLENEFQAIKDASTEQTMAIRTTKNDIERLQEFADPLKLDSIITKFKDILTSPFMLKMLLETLTKFPSETANKAELYRLFANIHFEREKDKMLRTEKVPPKFNIMDSFYHYSKDLAVNMFFRKVTSIHAKNHGYKAVGFVETIKAHMWSRFFDDTDILTKLARRGAQIIEDDGVIRFMHRSIMEYFTARYFFDEIVDYDPDQSEDYDPSLNRGLIVETETDVYQFLMHLTDSQEKTRQKKESEKGQKGMTVLEKKILEVLGSPHLRKQYGTDFENNFFYQNVFLILLLDLSLATKIAELKDDSAVVSTIDSIFRWIFNPSGTSHKFVEVIRRAAAPGETNLYQILQPLVHIHYHLISKPNSGIKYDDPPVNSANQLKVRLCIKTGSPSLIAKDGVIAEAKDNTAHPWTLDIKLFVYGSQEHIVILSSEAGCFAVKSLEEQNTEKKSAANKNEKNENNNKNDKNGKKGGNETLKAFALNKNQTPWNVRECKWILRMSQDSLIDFALQSMSDPSKILFGGFKSFEEYNLQFKGVCSNDVTVGYFSCKDRAYICETCNMIDPDVICENCKEQCHKDHKVVKSNQTYGLCYCQVSGFCGITRGCTAKLETFIQGEIKYMFKCNQCPDNKKDTVLCVGCKKHHEKDSSHRDFAKIERVGERSACECNCISNRTKLIASCPQYGYGGYNNFSEKGVNIPKTGNMDDDEGDDDQDN